MPIYDQGYRRYEARGPLRGIRFWPITREALRMILSKRAFLGLLALSFLPFVGQVIRILFVTRMPEAGRVLPLDGRLFGEFLNWQIFFVIVLAIFGASGLVANDLRTGGILVYLSRPLSQRDYALGKLGVPLALGLGVTLAPGVALYAAAVGLAPEQFVGWKQAWIAPAIVVHSFAISVVISFAVLALSALSRSARAAGLGFFGLMFGLEFVRALLQHAFGYRAAMLVSPQADLRSLGASLFGLPDRDLAFAWMGPAAVLAALVVGCVLVLRARIRAVEIVA